MTLSSIPPTPSDVDARGLPVSASEGTRVVITESIGRPATCQVATHLNVRRELVGAYGRTSAYRMTCEDCDARWQLIVERRP